MSLEGFPQLAASSLCAFRKKISFNFFKNIFDKLLSDYWGKLNTYQGLHIIGIDGDEFSLSATGDALDEGYRGRATKDNKETYYPRMFVVKAVLLMSGVVCGFHYSKSLDEITGALEILQSLPKKILAVYDRFYFSKRLIEGHETHGSYFICRCKTGGTFIEIVKFAQSLKRSMDIVLHDVPIRLVKIKNPQTKKDFIFATNLPKSAWGRKQIEEIYQLRWECETVNRDQGLSMKMESFHSKDINGILQELYSSLIIHNILRIEAYENGGFKVNPDTKETKKTNFKLLIEMSVQWLNKLWEEKIEEFIEFFKDIVVKNISKRKRLSRWYEREFKNFAKSYKNSSLVSRRC
jgi:hypothetical protein